MPRNICRLAVAAFSAACAVACNDPRPTSPAVSDSALTAIGPSQLERGRTIFYQSELPYDPPSQAAWQHDGTNGWASYFIGGRVHTHEAWGMGVYSYFNQGMDIREETAIAVPAKPGVVLHDMVTVFLNGSGGIEHTINDVGTPLIGSFGTSYVIRYPAA